MAASMSTVLLRRHEGQAFLPAEQPGDDPSAERRCGRPAADIAIAAKEILRWRKTLNEPLQNTRARLRRSLKRTPIATTI